MKYFIFSIFFVLTLSAQQNDSNRFMLAQNYERAGNLEKALEIYSELYAKQPQNQVYFKELNDMYRQLKQYQQSIRIIEEQIAMFPGNVALEGELGKTFFLMDDDRKAYEIWDAAVDNNRQIPQIYRTIANYAIEMRAFDKAIEYLQAGKKNGSNPVMYAYDLSYLYTIKMQYESAAEEYAFILELDNNQISTVRSRVLQGEPKPEFIEAMITVFADKDASENSGYTELLAMLYLENKDYANAFAMYKLLDEQRQQNGTILFQYAQRIYQAGAYPEASDAFQYILDAYPESAVISNARLGFARTREAGLEQHYQKNLPHWKPFYKPPVPDPEPYLEVINAYKEIIDDYPGSEASAEAAYRIAAIYDLLAEPEKAVEYLQSITASMQLSSHYSAALLLLGDISIRQGALEKAAGYYEKARINRQTNIPLYNTAQYNIMLIHFYQGEIDSAIRLLGSITSQLQDDRANDALQLSLLLNKKMNDSLMLIAYGEAELKRRQYNYEEALALYTTIAADENSYVLNQAAMLNIAQTLTALNRYEEAVSIIDSILTDEGSIYADKSLFLKAQILQYGLLDLPKALAAYEKLLATFPNSLYLDKAREQIIFLRERIS